MTSRTDTLIEVGNKYIDLYDKNFDCYIVDPGTYEEIKRETKSRTTDINKTSNPTETFAPFILNGHVFVIALDAKKPYIGLGKICGLDRRARRSPCG